MTPDPTNKIIDPAHLYDGVASAYELAWTVPASLPLLGLFDRLLPRYAPQQHHTRILELACGTAFLLRRARYAIRPHYVVGVDISSDMIKEAQRIEDRVNPGVQAPIDFVVADCTEPIAALEDQRGRFDVVMANFLFNYAKTEEEMARMWRNVATYLRPGGVFLATTQSFDVLPKSVQANKYGMHVETIKEGSTEICARQMLEFGWDDKTKVRFESFMISDEVIWQRTASKAGLKGLKFHRFQSEDITSKARTPDGYKGRDDAEYWQELLDHPFNYIMTARKEHVAK